MKIAVIATHFQKEEMLAQGVTGQVQWQVQWLEELIQVDGTDCYIDLLFDGNSAKINQLKLLQPAVIIVNDVVNTADNLPENFIRINGWPTFLKRTIVEASCNNADIKSTAEKIITAFNKTIEWVPDKAGFITARVIAMIINEAYLALEEGVSSKDEIDTAMKLGTSYPYGPFEWSNKIGLKNIYNLLIALAQTNQRYEPSALLKKEALS